MQKHENCGPAPEILTEDDLRPVRERVAQGADEAARSLYLSLLARDPTDFRCLTELGALAYAGEFRSAARTAYEQAVLFHPDEPVGRVNLANLLREQGEMEAARNHFLAALALLPNFAPAHQGLALLLAEQGETEAAARHRHLGFDQHWMTHRPYRGSGPAPRVVLLVSALGGNIPVKHWLNDRFYDITAIYADHAPLDMSLPAHDLIFNTIGDADLCMEALARAERICAASGKTVINPPDRVAKTGRADTASRLRAIANLHVPLVHRLASAAIRQRADIAFPVLVRRPGFHTGQHFLKADDADELAEATLLLDPAGNNDLLLIDYLNARGADGLARKYRMMFIDGGFYPLHLALSRDWKVHYFSSAMSEDDAFRQEEQRYLDGPQAVLGSDGMAALASVADCLGLDYAGIDFGFDAQGQILVFEVNATMVLLSPNDAAIWDYRRPAIEKAFAAARTMLARRLGNSESIRNCVRATP